MCASGKAEACRLVPKVSPSYTASSYDCYVLLRYLEMLREVLIRTDIELASRLSQTIDGFLKMAKRTPNFWYRMVACMFTFSPQNTAD